MLFIKVTNCLASKLLKKLRINTSHVHIHTRQLKRKHDINRTRPFSNLVLTHGQNRILRSLFDHEIKVTCKQHRKTKKEGKKLLCNKLVVQFL